MPSARRVTAPARAREGARAGEGAHAERARDRGIARVTREVAILIANVRESFGTERAAGRASGVSRPAERTARVTGVSRRTVERITADGYAHALPSGREAPTRNALLRIPADELGRVRAAA